MRICVIKYASQPDIQFACDDFWSTPAWGDQNTINDDLPPNCYHADGGRIYSFVNENITCEGCKKYLNG